MVLGPGADGRKLSLSDVFKAYSYARYSSSTGWEEQRYDVADQSNVLAAGTVVECADSYVTNGYSSLEFRLANRFKRLSFKVGQANDSLVSSANLKVEVLANTTTKDKRDVPFNVLQTFDVDVQSVGAVVIKLSLPCPSGLSSSDRYSVTGVVSDIEVTAA